MIKFAFGFAFCALIYYYFPDQVESLIGRAEEVVHESAASVADATKPNTIIDDIKEKLQ